MAEVADLLEQPVECSPGARLPEPRMRVECASRLDELGMHAEAWDRLAFFAPQRMPMLSHAWVSAYLEHLLKPGETWLCLLAHAGRELVGVLPVVRSPRGPLSLLGSRHHAPDDIDVLTGDMLLARGREEEVASALLTEFARREPGHAFLGLSRLPPESPCARLMADGFAGFRMVHEDAGCGSFLPTQGDFDKYFASTARTLRNGLKRGNKRLAGLDKVETRFLTGPGLDEEHMSRFFELEASGWKGQSGSAILSCPRRKAFFTALARGLDVRGMLEWHLLTVGGRLIAGHMAMRTQGRLTIWKIAYDEEFARFGPGSILQERMLRRAFASDDTDEVDFVSDWVWQASWNVQKRPYRNLMICSPRPGRYLGNLACLKARAELRQLRGRIKRSPALGPLIQRIRDLVRPGHRCR